MDSVCETCRWWGPNVAGHPAVFDKKCGACRNSRLALSVSQMFDLPERNGAGIDDTENGDGTFVTGPRFGCIHWEQKHEPT